MPFTKELCPNCVQSIDGIFTGGIGEKTVLGPLTSFHGAHSGTENAKGARKGKEQRTTEEFFLFFFFTLKVQ